jgi:hypothetical protein
MQITTGNPRVYLQMILVKAEILAKVLYKGKEGTAMEISELRGSSI